MQAQRPSRGVALSIAAAVIALVAIAAIVAGGLVRAGADTGSATPSPSPTAPAPSPTAPAPSPTAPTPSPTPAPSADDDSLVVLDVATPHTVSVAITDDTGTLVGAASGRAADGMSVRWFDVEVENVDADTLRLTWAGYAKDEIVDLAISTDAGGLRLRIVQSGPLPNTDALGADRVLLLDFDAPVAAEDILATIQESPATQD